jgi:hypothetical protein
VDVPPGQLALEPVGLDHAHAPLLADGDVLDLHEPLLANRLGERADEPLLLGLGLGLRLLGELEGAERLLELAAHALKR